MHSCQLTSNRMYFQKFRCISACNRRFIGFCIHHFFQFFQEGTSLHGFDDRKSMKMIDNDAWFSFEKGFILIHTNNRHSYLWIVLIAISRVKIQNSNIKSVKINEIDKPILSTPLWPISVLFFSPNKHSKLYMLQQRIVFRLLLMIRHRR